MNMWCRINGYGGQSSPVNKNDDDNDDGVVLQLIYRAKHII